MSKPNYRVNVTFDGERKLFLARAPELEHCTAEGTSRGEAIGKLEEEIDAQLANMLSHGVQPPRSVDEETFSGEVSAKISKGLHKEITYQARSEGVEVEQLVAELLSAAMESRKQTRAPRSGNRAPAPAAHDHDNIGNRSDHHHGGGSRPRGGFGRQNNSQLLDDRASFIEYVRGLENNGGYPAGNRGHGGGGHGGPGGHGGDGRRRRRGRGGGGGNPNFRGPNQGGNGHQQHRGPNGAPAQHAAPPSHDASGAPTGNHGSPGDDHGDV